MAADDSLPITSRRCLSLPAFLHLRLPRKINQALVLRATVQNKHRLPSPRRLFFRPTFLLTFYMWREDVSGAILTAASPSVSSFSQGFFSFLCHRCLSGSLCWFWRSAVAQPVTQQTLWHMLRIWKETRPLCRKHFALRLRVRVDAQKNSAVGFYEHQPSLSVELNKRLIFSSADEFKRRLKISFTHYSKLFLVQM